jgi:hypothetical protein
MSRFARFSSLLVVLLGAATASTVAACSSSAADAPAAADDAAATTPDDLTKKRDAGSDAQADAGAFVPVAAPPLAVIPNQGGPIVAHPEVLTITWQSDPLAADLEAFDGWMVASAFWKTMMAEWGVGPGTHGTSYRIPTAAPATLDGVDVEQLLRDAIAQGKLPAASPSRIYAVYPPAGTTVTSFGSKGCEGFQAFHYAFATGGTQAIYAVTPRCADSQGMSPLDFTTWGMSHEIMEAASDPIASQPAYRIDTQSLATPQAGENADLCAGQPTTVDGHLVTRNWSNAAAKAGQRPCVPAPPGPMFGAFAEPGEVTISPGGTAKIRVRLYSSAPMAPFKLSAYPLDPELTATLSGTSGANGGVLTLTLAASAGFVEQPGSNLVELYAFAPDYTTKGHLIVHAK